MSDDVLTKYQLRLGANVFLVTPIDALESFDLQTKIGPAILGLVADLFGASREIAAKRAAAAGEKPPPDKVPSFDEAAEAAGKVSLLDGAELEELLPYLFPILTRFSQQLDGQLKDVTMRLLSAATVDGKMLFNRHPNGAFVAPHHYSLAMQGRMTDAWRLLIHAVRVNYPDFFGALVGLLGPDESSASSAT